MLKKPLVKALIYPGLIIGLFWEVAHNHSSGPHSTRHERIEELRQRKMETVSNKTRRSAPPVQGGQAPEPVTPEETLRQMARRRGGASPNHPCNPFV